MTNESGAELSGNPDDNPSPSKRTHRSEVMFRRLIRVAELLTNSERYRQVEVECCKRTKTQN